MRLLSQDFLALQFVMGLTLDFPGFAVVKNHQGNNYELWNRFSKETNIVTVAVAQIFPCLAQRENCSVTSSETVSTYLAKSVLRQISAV